MNYMCGWGKNKSVGSYSIILEKVMLVGNKSIIIIGAGMGGLAAGAIKKYSRSDTWGEMMMGSAWDFYRQVPAMLSAGKWFKVSMQQYADRFTDPFLKKAFPLHLHLTSATYPVYFQDSTRTHGFANMPNFTTVLPDWALANSAPVEVTHAPTMWKFIRQRNGDTPLF